MKLMDFDLHPRWSLPPKGWRFLIITLLILGTVVRFVNLDHKVYWGDETYSSLRIAGYKWADLAQVFDNREVVPADLQKFQQVNPERHWGDMIDSLAVEDPHHPPFYYSMARLWVQWFGDTVSVRRSLSALLSLLVFPAAYWLCLELFGSPLVGWMAIALLAVSPFHLLYAQEVREYSLWTAITLMSSAALVRAQRQNTKVSWAIYAVTVAMGLYTFLFAALVTFAHGVYLLIAEGFRISRKLLTFVGAAIAGVVLFSPWLYIVITNVARIQVTNSDKTDRVPWIYLLKMWSSNVNHIFFDLQFGYSDPFNLEFSWQQPSTFLIPFTYLLVGYALYYVYRHAPKPAGLFVLAFTGVCTLALILPDVIIGGSVSINSRYLTPAYLGMQIAVAYLLVAKSTDGLAALRQQQIWKGLTGLVLTASVLSCAVVAQADTSWIKYTDYYSPEIARIVNRAERPLFVTDNPYRGLPLSYLLDPKVKMQVSATGEAPKVAAGYRDIFIMNAYRERSRKFRENFEQVNGQKLELAYRGVLIFKNRDITLWRVKQS